MTSRRFGVLLATVAVAAGSLVAQAPITIVVVDPPGVGFNDPTPAEPVGDNTGSTIGEQRLMALRYAAAIWSSRLESPTPIRVRASFKALPCTAAFSLLASTQVSDWFSFTNGNPEIILNIWYPVALANRLTGTVLDPDKEEIELTVNADYGQPGCAATEGWYYGLDNRAPASRADMVATLLHELAHGLGFGPLSTQDFSKFRDRGDVFSEYVLDTSTGKSWNKMTDEERAASAANTHALVWNGINVRKSVPYVLQPGTPTLRIAEPRSIAGDLYVQTATFGVPLSAGGVSGLVVAALDAADAGGPSTIDACSPILNGSEVAGRIALVERGTCSFVQKARNIQTAGAIGLIVTNNVEDPALRRMTGADADGITIPLVQVTLADGNAMRAALADFQAVTVELLADPSAWAGADRAGRPMLFNPTPAVKGASMSHWDPIATPNQLMEPDIAVDLTYSVEPPEDLTLPLLRDLGWFADFDGIPDGIDECPGSDRGATVVLQGCDTGVKNTAFVTGCRISDFFKPCEPAGPNSGDFAACVGSVTQQLLQSRTIAPRESQKIQACVPSLEHP